MTAEPLLFTGATLVDGSGSPGYRGDLLVAEGKIQALGELAHAAAPQLHRVDCRGLVLAPGFIDAHSHSDLQVLESRTEKLQQGVTAEVVGNCGFSAYPAAHHRPEIHNFANGIFCGQGDWGWSGARDYLDAVKLKSRFATVGSLVGHGTLRISVAGPRLGPLASTELDTMSGLLRESLEEGATGLSTGLMYAPGSSAAPEELELLCSVVAKQNKLYCSHIRDYSFGLVAAVEEQLSLARRTGCRLQISHLQAVGRMNWPHQQAVLTLIEEAREQGIDVAFDCYPYVAGSTVLTQLLPQSALDGGNAALVRRLSEPIARREIARRTLDMLPHRWADILLSAVASVENQDLVGLNLEEIGALRNRDPLEALLDILIEERGEANMISFNQSEPNLRQTLSHPLSVVISDGFYVKGKAHPRLYGTFPLLLGSIARDRSWMPLETAIHKVTGKAAERFGFAKRGRLKPGYYADLVLFDPQTIGSNATFSSPEVPPHGLQAVYRCGAPVWPLSE